MATLVVQSGKHRGKQLKVPSSEIKIGRDPHCQIRIPSTEISREHCILRAHPEGIVVIDLGSKNGTYVNGMAINGTKLLRPGDTLHVGPMIFEVAGGKKEARVVADAENVKNKSKSSSASEDDIASWLEDGVSSLDNIAGDTTLVTSRESLKNAHEAAKIAAAQRDAELEQEEEVAAVRRPELDKAEDLIKQFWAKQKSES